jgi:transcription elongation factor Elf1
MDASRSELLGALASDAALERGDFLVRATDQLKRFLDANAERISALGGMTLIDDDPDFLSIAPDLSFRSRSRYLDDTTGEWVSETEVIETAAELVELYNPADVYAAFSDAYREAAGLPPEPTASEDLLETARIPATDAVGLDAAYAAAADEWAAGEAVAAEPADEETAAQRLYDLALTFQERSQRDEARLLEDFAEVTIRLSEKLGDVIVVDDDDERLLLKAGAGFRGEVVPDDADGEWRNLATAEEIVEFYDPTDVFGDLADSLAEAFPSVAPGADEAEGEDEEDDDDDDEDDDAEAGEDAGPDDDGTGDRDRA